MRSTLVLMSVLPLAAAILGSPSGSRSLSGARGAARDGALEPIGFHDNDRPAGRLAAGELRLALEIRRGDFRPNGTDRPGTPMLAFAERGGEPTIPGPLVRVTQGTRVRVAIANRSDSTVVMRGLSDVPTDSTILAPGATGDFAFTAAEPGNRFYYGTFPGRTMRDRRTEDGHLSGAIVVDASGAPGARAMAEQVLVISASYHSVDSLGRLNNDREVHTVNGRPWPRTKRLTGTVGDSMRFRVINATRDAHPIHLHGVYFRVDARGSAVRDTTLAVPDRRMVVTELLPTGTMTMVWMPEKPGTWLFHCHLTFHVTPNPGFAADSLTADAYDELLLSPHGNAHPEQHVETGMGGIMMAITVPPPRGWRLPAEPARRVVRFLVPGDSQPGERVPYFTPSIEADGRLQAPPAGRTGPGATLFLRQGEPTEVRVVNGGRDHLAIHWHGMEIESLYDGVVGLGGTPGQHMRPVAPNDSFAARMTPPRAGTFIYHTHFMEVRQQTSGLYGPMIVLPRDEPFDGRHDHILIAGPSRTGVLLNGAKLLDTLVVDAGSTHRLRMINITTGSTGLQFHLIRADGTPMRWTRVAKDGMDLPAAQRREQRASQPIAMGETYDMLVEAHEPGEYRLEVRSAAGAVLATQPIRIVR